jgi:hypothetical protein
LSWRRAVDAKLAKRSEELRGEVREVVKKAVDKMLEEEPA